MLRTCNFLSPVCFCLYEDGVLLFYVDPSYTWRWELCGFSIHQNLVGTWDIFAIFSLPGIRRWITKNSAIYRHQLVTPKRSRILSPFVYTLSSLHSPITCLLRLLFPHSRVEITNHDHFTLIIEPLYVSPSLSKFPLRPAFGISNHNNFTRINEHLYVSSIFSYLCCPPDSKSLVMETYLSFLNLCTSVSICINFSGTLLAIFFDDGAPYSFPRIYCDHPSLLVSQAIGIPWKMLQMKIQPH